jgi:oligopeptidase B
MNTSRHRGSFFLLAWGTLILTLPISCQSSPNAVPKAPVAEARPHELVSEHGTRTDDYYWLRDDTRADVDMLNYLAEENRYTQSMLEPVAAVRKVLNEELVQRLIQDDTTPPILNRGYWYQSSYVAGKEYPIHKRAPQAEPNNTQVLLDVNELAAGHTYYSVGARRISPSNQLMAYGEDNVGRRQYTIRIKDLASGKMLADQIPNTTSGIVWGEDNRSIFYIEKDPVTLLGMRVKRHILGTNCSEDKLIYEEHDTSFYLSISRSGDRKFIMLHLSSTISDEVRYLAADDVDGDFKIFEARQRGHEYHADHIGNRWIVRSNWNADNFRLLEVPDKELGARDKWVELVPHSAAVYVSGFTLFDEHLVISERSEGLQRLRIRRWSDGDESFVRSDEPAYSARVSQNPEQSSDWLRYQYTSLTTPSTIYELNMKSGERKLVKRQEVGGGFEAKNYATKREWAPARDGTMIPVSLVYRKGTALDGTAPLYQYAYGSYGSSSDPRFRSNIISLLDRGFVYAIAHVRGGQEMGRDWYEQGKLLNKKNTFTDFIDVTEFLVASGDVDPERVAIAGGSAGGLLVGAVANMRPDLYRVIIAGVPFVDVVTTMLDESIPLTTNEFDEWGNPTQAEYYDYMLSYSPYDNVAAQDYPAMLVTTGLWDSQVQYFEPAKWVAKLRAMKTDDEPLLMHVNMEAGHGGASGRFRRLQDVALEYAFVLQQLDLPAE